MPKYNNSGVQAMVILRRLVQNMELKSMPRAKSMRWMLKPGMGNLVSDAVTLLYKVGATTHPCTQERDGEKCSCQTCRDRIERAAKKAKQDEQGI